LYDAIKRNPNASPSQLVGNEMLACMDDPAFNWDDLGKITEHYSTLKQIQNMKTQVKSECNPCGQHFEALALFRDHCKLKDEFFIYKMNNRMLNDSPSFVFKSSLHMANLAISLDSTKDTVLSKEYIHVDATHTRCKDFQTLTLWVYHPVMRKLLQLAIMDIEKENTTNLVQFWSTLNEMLQKVSGDPTYVINPTGFVVDEHHANWNSIRSVFGEDAIKRVVSCEFHFKQSIQRHAKGFGDEEASQLFIAIAERMLTVMTISAFNIAVSEMERLVDDHPRIYHWLQWWLDRKTHIFRCYKPLDAPNSNLAEVGHSKLKHYGRSRMSLLEAAKMDIIVAVCQEKECTAFDEGLATGGRGADSGQRIRKEHRRSLDQAAAYGLEVVSNEFGVYVPSSGIHRPPSKPPAKEKGKRIGKKQSKKAVEEQERLANKQVVDSKSTDDVESNTPARVVDKFHIVLQKHHQLVKKCYGCKGIVTPKKEIILQNFCQREYFERSKMANCLSPNKQAVYFHLNLDCIRKVYPTMEISDVVLHDEVRSELSSNNFSVLAKFGFVVMFGSI
jgi:hypothetical protein